MRPTSVSAPATQKQPMNVRRELNLLRLRILLRLVAPELAVAGLLHAEVDRARREQRGARFAGERVFDLDAFLVELVDQASERFALITEVAALHADPDMAAEQQRECDEAYDEATAQPRFLGIEEALACQQF